MYVVALTGGIGSGKTEAANIFAKLGVPVVDVDAISHALTEKPTFITSKIGEAFGAGYLTPEGALHRARMRALVFSNDEAREKLNAILHPAIYEETLKQLQSHTDTPYQILVIPLLFESARYLPLVQRILVIDCDEATQIRRVMERSKLNEDEVKNIIAAQTPRQERLKRADDVLENSDNLQELAKKIDQLHKKYLKSCIVSKTT
ncbi:MAG TPA: dephospho-CoA kinase [Methylophilus sp.]|nr:dephospho-CoA kinase [Methylophilus sp.]HQQ33620.1 dephospho-CoA kinase [Methylophilus sp.]